MVKAFAWRAAGPGFDSRLRRGDVSGSSYTRDLKTGTSVVSLPGAWRYRIRARTGWNGVSIQWLGEVESLVFNVCLSVAAATIDWADRSLRYISMLPTNNSVNSVLRDSRTLCGTGVTPPIIAQGAPVTTVHSTTARDVCSNSVLSGPRRPLQPKLEFSAAIVMQPLRR